MSDDVEPRGEREKLGKKMKRGEVGKRGGGECMDKQGLKRYTRLLIHPILVGQSTPSLNEVCIDKNRIDNNARTTRVWNEKFVTLKQNLVYLCLSLRRTESI